MSEPAAGTPGGGPATMRTPLDMARSGPYFAGLLLIALVAFWPSYLSKLTGNSVYTHVHAVLATTWILLLILQPMLIRRRRRDLHRLLGRASYAVGPMVVISIVLLAHSRLSPLEGERFTGQSYFFYLQASLAVVFAIVYGLAVRYRTTASIHARFMICTSFTLIDPILIRIIGPFSVTIPFNPQWITFGLTDALIVALIVLDRGTRKGRWVLPAMLPLFILSQLPALMGLTGGSLWQSFARWFAALPLT